MTRHSFEPVHRLDLKSGETITTWTCAHCGKLAANIRPGEPSRAHDDTCEEHAVSDVHSR